MVQFALQEKGQKMKKLVILGMAAIASAALAAQDKVAVKFVLPAPHSSGTPKEVKSDNLEPDRGLGKLRDPIMVPQGYDKLLSKDCKVTASVPEDDIISGDLDALVDGDKTPDATCMLQLPSGLQWVQIDLGAEHEISAICVWHDQGDERVYRDVIVQVSNDAKFVDGVQTVFNNDHDNTAKLGAGKDKEYRERFDGRPMDAKLVKGRYVRCYSNGSTADGMNTYAEVEVFGK